MTVIRRPLFIAAEALLLLALNLSAAEPAWKPLPASEWHWNNHKAADGFPKVWTIEADGSIHHAAGDGVWRDGDLTSNATYENFELELDWKVGKAANSGIFYRVDEGHDRIFERCFEYQILDDIGFHDGHAPTEHRAASLFPLLAASPEKKLNPVGEWNTARIVVRGQKVEHWLNGKNVLSFDVDSPEYQSLIAKSTWPGVKKFGLLRNGRLGLQDHGGEVWFRNIRVRSFDTPDVK